MTVPTSPTRSVQGRPWILAVPLALWLVSADRQDAVDALVRQGNAAYAAGDFAAALRLYEQAEDQTTDPGLVAFNEGAVFYRLGQYAEAERRYLRAREGATGERRARVLYDLGNSLVQQAGDRDVALLERAIASYDECLRQPEAAGDLAAGALENRRLAEEFLQRAKTARKQPLPEPPRPEEPPRPPEGRGEDRGEGNPADAPEGEEPGAREGADRRSAADRGGAVPSDRPPPPGAGSLLPVPDEDEWVPLSPEETAAHLRQAAARIAAERQEHRHRAVRIRSANVRDW